MPKTRLEFALEHLALDDWKAFEEFASAFLASEFPNLRTIAGTNDLGRDAVLFQSDNEPDVVIQYSIAGDWRSKVRNTVRRLTKKKIRYRVLVYASNQEIGPKADDLRADLRRSRISLDVRDRSYWVERRARTDATRAAAEQIESRVVDPLLPARELVAQSAVTSPDLRAGLLYLELHLRDVRDGGTLSHVTYESIVMAVMLRAAEQGVARLSQPDILARAAATLPSREAGPLRSYVDGAVSRLRSAGKLTFEKKSDSYAISEAERLRLAEKALELSEERRLYRLEISDALQSAAVQLELSAPVSDSQILIDATEAVLESLLETQGNELAQALADGHADVPRADIYDRTTAIFTPRAGPIGDEFEGAGIVLGDLLVVAAEALSGYLDEPGPFGQRRLRTLADAYNLIAFVQEAADVQRVVGSMFRRGRIIVDATVLLPCFVETLLPPERRPYSALIKVAGRAGIRLDVTDGVLNELETHLVSGVRFERTGGGQSSRVPYVLARWREQGLGGAFSDFVSRFMGEHPLDDLADFLSAELNMSRQRTLDVEESMDDAERWRAIEIWRELKGRQRRDADPGLLDLLLGHDVEMYFGTIARRSKEQDTGPFGYQAWFLTTDWTAFALPNALRQEAIALPSDPCMHPNFLSNLLAIGPARSSLDEEAVNLLPVAIEIHERGLGIPLLSNEVERIRSEYSGMPEYFLRRKMRERVERLKQQRTVVRGDALDWELGMA